MDREQVLNAIVGGTTAHIPNLGPWHPIIAMKKVKAKGADTVVWTHKIGEDFNQKWIFHPKATYMIGALDVGSKQRRRFTVGSVHVDDQLQSSIEVIEPKGQTGTGELLSDVFNRSDDPLLVTWKSGQSDIKIRVFNINEEDIIVFVCVWCEVEIVEIVDARSDLKPFLQGSSVG